MADLVGSGDHLRPAGTVLAIGLSFAISFLTPYLMGRRLRGLAREEVPVGIRPRRQWAISGLSISLAIALPLALLGWRQSSLQAAALIAGVAGCAGVLNDIMGLPRLVQFVFAVGIALFAVSEGVALEEVKPPFTAHMITLGHWSGPATVVWLLAVAYAVVLCRRLPRLTAGLVAIVSLTFGLAALVVGPSRAAPAAGLLALCLTAAAAGAARRDYPALGSAAHWATGFTLGVITITGMLKNTAFLVLGVPLLALGIPVGETTYAIVYGAGPGRPRLALGQRRELLHDALIRTGLSPRRTVLVFHLATAYLCAVALALVTIVRVTFLVKLGLLAAALVVGFVAFFMLARILAEPRGAAEEQVDMFGVPIACIAMEQAVGRVEQFVRERSPHLVVTSDSTGLVRAHDDPEFQRILQTADMVTADGRGVVWMARVLGLPMRERVSGVDMMDRICALAAERGYCVYLLGGLAGVAEEAARAMQARHPGLRVAGTHHGYFAPEEEPGVVRAVAAARPDILFVAFGAPKQEKWIRQHQAELAAPVAIGVGGSFDVFAGRVRRAPEWMQRAGLEWLYRAMREPKRLPRLWALPRLVWMTLRAAWRRRG
jgi:N-acetylglucosaminyldiphosphoundecaprenol N-acetyl-beta-D-mannosaminyltransferase